MTETKRLAKQKVRTVIFLSFTEVSIAKSGDSYVARRENESVLYQLDSSAINGLQKAADEMKPAVTPGK